METKRKTQKKGVTIVEIEFQNYVKDRIDEILATGDFPDITNFIHYAVMYSIAGYNRCLVPFPNQDICNRPTRV
jgi:hypothetical protein